MRNFLLGAILLVLGAGLSLRLSRLASHHTHVDDIGVAQIVLDPGFYPYNLELEIDNPQHYIYKKPLAARVRASQGATKQVYLYLLQAELIVKRYVLGARWLVDFWTFAPATLYIQAGLIWPWQSYETIKTLGRFPAALYSCLGLVCCLWVCYRLVPQRPELVLLVLTLQALSWQGIILASHMAASYAAGQAFIWLLAALWLRWTEQPQQSSRTWALGLALALAPLFSYQLLFLVPLLAAMFWLKASQEKPAFDTGRKYLALATSTLISWGIAAKIISSKTIQLGVVTWAWGEKQQYHLSGWNALDLSLGPKMAVWFRQLYDSFWVQAAPGLEGNPAQTWVLAALWTVFGIGAISSVAYWRKNHPKLGLWLGSCLVIFLGLYVTGRITLSPTRHTYIYLALLLIGVLPGLARWPRKLTLVGASLFSIALMVLFVQDYSQQNLGRFDYWNQATINRIIEEEKPTIVVQSGWASNLMTMPGLWLGHPERKLITSLDGVTYDGKPWLIMSASTQPDWMTAFIQTHRTELQLDTLYRYQAPVAHEYSSLTVNHTPSLFIVRMLANPNRVSP